MSFDRLLGSKSGVRIVGEIDELFEAVEAEDADQKTIFGVVKILRATVKDKPLNHFLDRQGLVMLRRWLVKWTDAMSTDASPSLPDTPSASDKAIELLKVLRQLPVTKNQLVCNSDLCRFLKKFPKFNHDASQLAQDLVEQWKRDVLTGSDDHLFHREEKNDEVEVAVKHSKEKELLTSEKSEKKHASGSVSSHSKPSIENVGQVSTSNSSEKPSKSKDAIVSKSEKLEKLSFKISLPSKASKNSSCPPPGQSSGRETIEEKAKISQSRSLENCSDFAAAIGAESRGDISEKRRVKKRKLNKSNSGSASLVTGAASSGSSTSVTSTSCSSTPISKDSSCGSSTSLTAIASPETHAMTARSESEAFVALEVSSEAVIQEMERSVSLVVDDPDTAHKVKSGVKKKRVSWKPDAFLEDVRIFEPLPPLPPEDGVEEERKPWKHRKTSSWGEFWRRPERLEGPLPMPHIQPGCQSVEKQLRESGYDVWSTSSSSLRFESVSDAKFEASDLLVFPSVPKEIPLESQDYLTYDDDDAQPQTQPHTEVCPFSDPSQYNTYFPSPPYSS